MKKSRLLEIIREEISYTLNEMDTNVSVPINTLLKYAGDTSEYEKYGNTSVKNALQFINALNKLTQDEIDDVEALGQAVNYDDAIVNAARDIRGLNEKYSTKEASYGSSIEEEDLNEMAKITGNLKSSIEKVIQDNPDLEGLPLKKKIKADKSVENALEGDTLYDNQLNKFIALIKGEREVGKRGRKANPTEIPTTKSLKKPTPDKRVSKPIKTTGMDDEDKEAFKSGESDEIAKSISKSTPEEKKEKFNLGLKFIKKYKDDKPKIDAYLKKAKEEYKLSTSMLKDLKRAAGRDVKS